MNTIPAVPLSLSGRTALITGGSRGIGAAAVRLFTAAGARVAFSFNTAREPAEALARACGGSPQCTALKATLATVEDGEALVHAALGTLGSLDILVANHGVWPAHEQPIATMPAAQWRHTLGVNLDSIFGLVRAATAAMQQPAPTSQTTPEPAAQPASQPDRSDQPSPRPPRHIVLVASTAAQRGEAFHADYAASKGALVSLTKSLATELAPNRILTNCVAPGWVETDMSAPALQDRVTAAPALGKIPLGRAATPEEIAGPILFLCTPLAGFITGEILNVNGGAVLVG